MADPITLGVAGLGILGTLAGWAKARATAGAAQRERERLDAERELEQERQESEAQTSMLGRLARLEGRVDTQAETIATLYAEKAELQRQVNELGADNVRLANRVVQLELERDTAIAKAEATEARAKLLIQQWEADKAKPSTKSSAPPGAKPR